VLGAAGIPSVLSADDAGGAYPSTSRAARVSSSRKADAEDALRSCPTLARRLKGAKDDDDTDDHSGCCAGWLD
jgi:ferredoxin